MTVSKRFSHFLKEKKLSQKEFCQITGYGYQSLTKFLSGQTSNPGINLLIVTKQHFPEINIEWLVSGEGPIWNQEELDRKGLPYKNKAESAPEDIEIIGKVNSLGLDPISRNLLETKEELIAMQKEQIIELKERLEECKKK